MITGIASVTASIPDGADLVLDATEGIVVVSPTGEDRETAESIYRTIQSAQEQPVPLAGEHRTADGVPLTLLLNISDPLEAEAVTKLGADGIGLYRSEFFYMDRPWWPSEEDNYAVYCRVAEAIGEKELNIRLADFGAEKSPPYADIPVNRNPSLGIRGVRLLLQRDDILRPQVKALARLARDRPLTVLLPMIDTLDTLLAITERLLSLCRCRRREQLPFRLGAMIEVPSAALLIGRLVHEVDAVSIGLNDLAQYLLAADRDDELVESYHDALQPTVLRLVKQTIDTARSHNKPVTMCGELAGNPALAPVLLALGAHRFSVSRSQLHSAAIQLQRLAVSDLESLAIELLEGGSGEAVRRLLAQRGLPTGE